MENKKSNSIDRLSEASIEAARNARSKLNMHLMLSALANLLILLGWFLFSVAGISNVRLLLGLLILTMLAWLWLIVIASRRFLFLNDERQESNSHRFIAKQHLIAYWVACGYGMHRWQISFAFVVVLIILCFLWLYYSNVDDWVLQLLRKIGTDCVWCSIVPP